METILMYSIELITISIIIAVTKSKIKGKLGEITVKILLNKLNNDEYIVINDVVLTSNGNTSVVQIDHVIVSIYGLFCIETKNYKGQIYGDMESKQWTQNIYGKKYRFFNPIHQNYAHIKSLRSLLNDNGYTSVPIYSIITFPGNTSLKVKIDSKYVYVVTWKNIVKTIKSLSKHKYILDNDLKELSKLILSYKNNSQISKEHVKEIKKIKTNDKRNIQRGICPKCGSKLVIRNGKYGKFYGCSNYPTCRFTSKN